MPCRICDEKEKLIKEKDSELRRILPAYRKDKESWRKKERKYWIVLLVSVSLNVLLAIYGDEAVEKLLEIASKFWG